MPKRVLGLLLTALGLSGCQLIQDQLGGNQPPVLSDFVAEPAEGQAPLLVGFSWSAADVEGDALSCTLVYGSEREQVENCGEVTHTFHTFAEPGGYTVVLQAHDGMNRAARSIAVRVLEEEMEGSGSLELQERLTQGDPLQRHMTRDSTRTNKRVLLQ